MLHKNASAVKCLAHTAGLVAARFGLTLVYFGNCDWRWYADMALALGAAFINLPIREAPLPVAIRAAA